MLPRLSQHARSSIRRYYPCQSLISTPLHAPKSIYHAARFLTSNTPRTPSATPPAATLTAATHASPAAASTEALGSTRQRPTKPLTSRRLARIYSQLSKAKLTTLVVASAGYGVFMAGPPLDPGTLIAVCAGTALCSASANTWNQLYEIKNDAIMSRTRARPLPSQRITPGHAAIFGAAMGTAGIGILATCCNPLTAALGAANIVLYAGVYTPWKQKHYTNTVVGALVGAVPPLMGMAAATGTATGAGAIAAAALLFAWQMPHFYALAWLYRNDYNAGGYSMISKDDLQGTHTAAEIAAYTGMLTALPFAAVGAGVCSPMFAVWGSAANLVLINAAWRFWQDRTDANARTLFRHTLWYLPFLMAVMALHATVWKDVKVEELTSAKGLNCVLSQGLQLVRSTGKEGCPHEMVKVDAQAVAAAEQGRPEPAVHALGCPASVGSKAPTSRVQDS